MQNKKPLLRSDWTIFMGGAVCFTGAVNCSLKNCTLTNLGSNAFFFNNFNRNCEVSDNLMFNLGLTEKQSAGVELAMCQSIIVNHNTVYEVPRTGINISEGTWGNNII